jgi:HD-like signal output (HDOD) protein
MIGAILKWLTRRRVRLKPRESPPAGLTPPAAPADSTLAAGDGLDLASVETGNALATERLWRVAFALPADAAPADGVHPQLRAAVHAALRAGTLAAKYFPRRPTLLPQLLRTVDDPNAHSTTIANMIAHDPVLAADVLRLANSSVYRVSSRPIETIQRALVVLGIEALRGIAVMAMLQPVFRATRSNFPRFPRLLWERSERAARAAEVYASATQPRDRLEAQVLVLLSALGPLVVYGVVLDEYQRRPELKADPAVCANLIGTLGVPVAQRVARHWQAPPRLLAALERDDAEPLTGVLQVGELLGTLSLLESHTVIGSEMRDDYMKDAGLVDAVAADTYAHVAPQA